ncbi:uncharacterized protein H6S33_012674 [Morchella sextelata]|uniref:uncharacterized protein n=1 Tax=Morchella sextelata TaxID=1174677 RepID=UPI001D04DA0A|nr:uncharacterized protein H6S33_012674 [Morchella sextelata]KAH0610128.1 hypothetical protein H6S33_012674 [Morchella sextelata]
MKSFTFLLLAAAAALTSALPTATITPTATNVCATTCPTVTSTIHPGYRCDAGSTETHGCPVARCIEPTTTITTATTLILPCSTSIITTTGGCTVPQSCVGKFPTTVTVTGGLENGYPCPTTCPILCPLPTVTQSYLLGGGCAVYTAV